MLVEVGMLFAAYFGVRLYENYKKDKKPQKKTVA